MSYRIAIDYGTTNSAAAAADLPGLDAQPVLVSGQPTIPSMVVFGKELLAGASAENAARIYPGAVAATPKKRLGDVLPVIRSHSITAVDAASATMRLLLAAGRDRRNGEPAVQVVLTHPAIFASRRRDALVAAVRAAGVPEEVPIGLLPEPVAAALRFHQRDTIGVGEFVAIYDLGAGTFDTAVLQRTTDGFVLHGEPSGHDEIGGELFDTILSEHVYAQLEPDDRALLGRTGEPEGADAARRFRTGVRSAKEQLSDQPGGAEIPSLRLTGDPLWLTTEELNELLDEKLRETVDILERTIREAAVGVDQLRAIYLVGGSSKIPRIQSLISERFNRGGRTYDDRKQVVALGAAGAPESAIAWDRELERTIVATPPPEVPKAPEPPPPVVDTRVPVAPGGGGGAAATDASRGAATLGDGGGGGSTNGGPTTVVNGGGWGSTDKGTSVTPPPPKKGPPIALIGGGIAILIAFAFGISQLASGPGRTDPPRPPATPTSTVPPDDGTDPPAGDGVPTVAGAEADAWIKDRAEGLAGISSCHNDYPSDLAAKHGAIAVATCEARNPALGSISYVLFLDPLEADAYYEESITDNEITYERDTDVCPGGWKAGSVDAGALWCGTVTQGDQSGHDLFWSDYAFRTGARVIFPPPGGFGGPSLSSRVETWTNEPVTFTH